MYNRISLDELTKPEEHLDKSDIIGIVIDSIEAPTKSIKAERKDSGLDETVKTSRILEKMRLHDFTKKSLSKCSILIPFPK